MDLASCGPIQGTNSKLCLKQPSTASRHEFHGLTTRASLSEQQDGWAGPPGQELGQAKGGGSRRFHESSASSSAFSPGEVAAESEEEDSGDKGFPLHALSDAFLCPCTIALTHMHIGNTLDSQTSESFNPNVISNSGQ